MIVMQFTEPSQQVTEPQGQLTLDRIDRPTAAGTQDLVIAWFVTVA